MIVALAAAVLLASQSGQAVLTPHEALAIRQLSDLRASPDGQRVAFVVTEPPDGTNRNRDIWLLEVRSRELRRLTFSPKSDSSPRWSRDGGRLAFLSDRDGPSQIYVLSMAGGEADRLTGGKNAIQAFEWSPDGQSLAFLASEPTSEADEEKERQKDDARVVDRDDRRPRVWVLDVRSRQVRQLTAGPWSISELQWMPAGDGLLVSATDRPDSDQETNQICVVGLADGAIRPVAAPRGAFRGLTVSPDGREFAYVAAPVDGPSPHDLYVQSIEQGAKPRNLTGASLDWPIGSFTWRSDGSILALAQNGFKTAFYSVAGDGSTKVEPRFEMNPTSFAVADGGVLVFVGETTTDSADIWVAERMGAAQKVSHLNESWHESPLIAPEFVRYKSFDGLEVEASLLRPRAYAVSAKLPLVVMVHGGPTGRWSDAFEPWGQLLAARGYAVLYPNIRGSVGYGHLFIEMNRADWGGGDFKDVMAGVDALIAKGIVDPGRLGIGGWSYGGYMAMWAVTQTDRFKASVAGAGLSDLASEFGTEDSSAYDEWFYGLPYEKLDGFIKSSPITYVKNARTPTLILQGEEDVTDPLGQSQQFHRGLKRYGVESEFVIYPREGHGLREEQHLLDRLNRVVHWFDDHLKGSPR